MGDGGRNCGFSTLEQCMATVSGIGGDCERNLFYEGPAERPTKSPRKRRTLSELHCTRTHDRETFDARDFGCLRPSS